MNEEQKCGYAVDGFIGNTRFTHFCKLPWGHSGVHEFPKFTSEGMMKPLPPTAEQTSIARFNALADQIRELHGLMLTPDGLFSYRQRIEERGREHSTAIAALCDSQADLHKKIDGIATILAGPLKLDKDADKDAALLADINESIAREKRMETTLHVIAKSMHLLSDKGLIQELQRNGYEIRKKSRAVAKKKAAPLVGKKGTGRKG